MKLPLSGIGWSSWLSSRGPQWWLLLWTAQFLALGTSMLALLAWVSFKAGGQWVLCPEDFAAGTMHFAATWLWAIVIVGVAESVFHQLFLQRDLGLFVTFPWTEKQLFTFKLRRLGRLCVLWFLGLLPLALAFRLGMGSDLRNPPAVPFWLLLAGLVSIVPAVLLALFDGLRRLVSRVVLTVTVLFMGAFVWAIATADFTLWTKHLRGDPHRAIWRFSPGAWLSDGAGLLGAQGTVEGLRMSMLCVILAVIAGGLAWLRVPAGYSRQRILNGLEARSLEASRVSTSESLLANRQSSHWLRRRFPDRKWAQLGANSRCPCDLAGTCWRFDESRTLVSQRRWAVCRPGESRASPDRDLARRCL